MFKTTISELGLNVEDSGDMLKPSHPFCRLVLSKDKSGGEIWHLYLNDADKSEFPNCQSGKKNQRLLRIDFAHKDAIQYLDEHAKNSGLK